MPLLSENAIYRILVAVGPTLPADFNLGGLRWELESLASHYLLGAYHRRAPADRNKKIDKAIAALEGVSAPETIAHLELLKSPVDQLPDISFGVGEGSAFEVLVGRWLKDAFEKYFRQRATYVRDRETDDPPDGPFIDFAEAALAEMKVTKGGKPYSRNSIAAALSKFSRR
jgi:hypothetical protein